MGDAVDKAKGRVKEAVGDLTDDDELQRQGKADQAEGKVKEVVDDVKEKVEGLIDRGRDRLDNDRP